MKAAVFKTIIRSTPQNINSSRQHRCVQLTDNTYIFYLCGAENELTEESYLEGLWKHYSNEIDMKYRGEDGKATMKFQNN